MRRVHTLSAITSLMLSSLVCLPLIAQDQPASSPEPWILPNAREIRPVGHWTTLAPYPFAIALRPDGHEAAIPSIGFPFSLNIVTEPSAPHPDVRLIRDDDRKKKDTQTHAGLTYSPDGRLLYVATGDSGQIAIYQTADWKQIGKIDLDGPIAGKTFTGSFAATVLCSSTGDRLYALDQGNWRIVVLDARAHTRIATVETGAYPFGLALSPDEKRLYVTNTGLFEYTLIPGAKPEDSTKAEDGAASGLKFPAFGFPSKAAAKGAKVEGKSIPGLGDANAVRGSSLWTYTLEGKSPVITARLRLGDRIGEGKRSTIGGAAPTGVAATADAVYVALAHQDAIVKLDPTGSRVIAETPLSPFHGKDFSDSYGRPLRGVMPSGVALRDGLLYVAESGIDAVAVLDASTMRLIEHIPAGWNPAAVALSPDGQTLFVVNAKGKGTGANGGKAHDPKSPSYIGSLEHGSMTAVSLRTLPSPDTLTATVVAANTAAIARRNDLPKLKHCFLIIRENRTYDEVLGDVSGANGDSTLARYGLDGWAEEKKGATHLRVTPNLHALAARFAMSDNFYVDSDVSADGHRWVMGINPTPFFNTAWTSNYGGRRQSSAFAPQPGRRAMFGGADAPMPEDQPQFGSLWEHVANAGKGILNYGEGLELEGNNEVQGLEPEGQRLLLNAPAPNPVFESSDRLYPTFNLGIPDQHRVDEFERDLRHRIALHKVPALIVIRLPNDHTAEIRPADGYPYRASFVADNDLALGRIVEFLSTTPLWKDSAVFVTEDDAQGGVDHVDAHRSVLMVASPWVKPGAVSHEHTSMGSIVRTIDELISLGPLNLEDALAGEITGIFDTTPHPAAFKAEQADPRVFIAAKAKTAHPKTKAQAAALRDMDDPDDIRPQVEATARKRRSVDKD